MSDKTLNALFALVLLFAFLVLVVFVTWHHFASKSGDARENGFWKWLRDLVDLLFGLG